MAIYKRVCIRCKISFDGGPRAWYCPSCRKDRQREREAKYSKAPAKRKLGSIDLCDNCGQEYVVNSGLQKYCPDCQPEMHRQLDAKQSIEYYHTNKDVINPARYERRRSLPRACAICGSEFNARGGKQKYCSKSCAKKAAKALSKVYYRRGKIFRVENPEKYVKSETQLKNVRTGKGVSQSELSRRSGVTQAMISRIELRKSDLLPHTAEKLAKALNVSPEELY